MLSYKKTKGAKNMPYKIIMEEVLDEMIDNISYIKLNSYIKLQKED